MTLQVGGHHAHHGAHPYREAYLGCTSIFMIVGCPGRTALVLATPATLALATTACISLVLKACKAIPPIKVKVKVGKSLHRLNFPVLTSSFRPLFDLPDAPSAVPPTSSEWVPGRPVPKPWRFY